MLTNPHFTFVYFILVLKDALLNKASFHYPCLCSKAALSNLKSPNLWELKIAQYMYKKIWGLGAYLGSRATGRITLH